MLGNVIICLLNHVIVASILVLSVIVFVWIYLMHDI